MSAAPDIGRLAARLAAAVPDFDATDQRIAVSLLRSLADGEPVPTARLAAEAEVSENPRRGDARIAGQASSETTTGASSASAD